MYTQLCDTLRAKPAGWRVAAYNCLARWRLLLVGAGIVDESTLPPCPDGIDKAQWTLVCTLDTKVHALRGLKEIVAKNVKAHCLRLSRGECGIA